MEETVWITSKAQEQLTDAGLSRSKIMRSQEGCIWACSSGMARRIFPNLFTTEITLANDTARVADSFFLSVV